MKNLAHPARIVALMLALPTLAHAHPGHDGHELTWDMVSVAPAHLAAHPLATVGSALGLVVLTWAVVRATRNARAQKARR